MSLESLLAEDVADVQRQAVLKDTSGGATRGNWPAVYTGIPVRIESLSSMQQARFQSLNIEATHTVLTQQAGVRNGDRFYTSDGTYLRVTGINQQRGMGGIDTFYAYTAIEVIVQ